jgi:16S rRNA (guanine966-N2)-methyltransferase
MWIKALELVDQNIRCLSEDGWVVVQIHPVEDAKLTLTALHEFDRRQYGSTLVIFYERNEIEDLT